MAPLKVNMAVKVCKHSQVEQAALRCFQREVSILYNNSHPNILEFIGACTWRVRALTFACAHSPRCRQCAACRDTSMDCARFDDVGMTYQGASRDLKSFA